eukprot:363687-Chlamydomonas_euryale.AAC.6
MRLKKWAQTAVEGVGWGGDGAKYSGRCVAAQQRVMETGCNSSCRCGSTQSVQGGLGPPRTVQQQLPAWIHTKCSRGVGTTTHCA